MYKQYATELFDRYMRERSDARDLSFRQIDAVIDALVATRFDHNATTDDVAKIVEQKFPQEESQMFRPTPQSGKSTQQQPTQSKEEQRQIITYFFNQKYWERVAPLAIPPVTDDAKMGSVINFKAFFSAIDANVRAGVHLRHDILSEIVLALDRDKLLEHFPTVVERVVEKLVPTPRTRREEAKQNFNLDKLMNRAESPIKGINEEFAKQPAASQAQLEAQARHDLGENETMGTVRSVIAGHSHSGSHAATKYEREILANVMNDGIRKNTPAETILANVKNKQNTMAKWGPQQALKELNPQLFTSQKPQGLGY